MEGMHKPESSSLLQGLSTAFITVCFLKPDRMRAAAYVPAAITSLPRWLCPQTMSQNPSLWKALGKLNKCPTSKPHLQAQAESPCWKYKKTDTHRAERFSHVEAKRLEVSKETS